LVRSTRIPLHDLQDARMGRLQAKASEIVEGKED
jgi:hypothetical protein